MYWVKTHTPVIHFNAFLFIRIITVFTFEISELTIKIRFARIPELALTNIRQRGHLAALNGVLNIFFLSFKWLFGLAGTELPKVKYRWQLEVTDVLVHIVW